MFINKRMRAWALLWLCWLWLCPASGLWAQEAGEASRNSLLTLRMDAAPVADILAEIGRQAGVTFSYESSLLRDLPVRDFRVEGRSLDACLDALLSPCSIGYTSRGRVVILKRLPRRVTVSGFVRDSASFVPLMGASVYEVARREGTPTNGDGFFSLTLPAGDVRLRVSYIGYKGRSFHFPALTRDTALSVELAPNARVREVVVTAPGQEPLPARQPLMGTLSVSQRVVRAIPTLLGEPDIVKTLQLTPGVSAGTEGLAGMYVRGGDPDGNLFLVDSHPVYQVGHLGGLFSAFNPEAIRGMDFFKAGFPARYGGRLSSVVDVHTREGNMREYHGSATIGLLSGGLSLEGPIVRDRTSFQIALRRSWADLVSAPALAIVNALNKKYGDKYSFRYAFHDLNLKLNHRFSERSRLFLSLYNGSDVLKGGREEHNLPEETVPYADATNASLRWGNLMASVGWTYQFNSRLYGRVSGFVTRYHSRIETERSYIYGAEDSEAYTSSRSETSDASSILDMGVRSQFDYRPAAAHRVRFGGDFLLHRFRPERSEARTSGTNQGADLLASRLYTDALLWAREASLFAEDDWTLTDAFRLNAGLRLSLFNIERTTYALLEPRLSARWLLRDDLSLKASYARMGQYVHLLSDSYIDLPTDSWMPVTSRLRPLISDQVSAGVYYDIGKRYSFSVEGYYKRMLNLLDYKDGYSFLPASVSWEEKMAVGEGRSYGMELMARKSAGRFTGWLAYTLSWSDRRFDEIDGGRRFPAKYDNRHKLNIVLTHRLSKRVELTAAWTYATGNRMTLSLENYRPAEALNPVPNRDILFGYYYSYYEGFDNWFWGSGSSLDYYTRRNNYRLPAYHRLDLGINIYRPKKRGRMGIWSVSIYNVYSRMNTFLVYKSQRRGQIFDTVPGQGGYVSSSYGRDIPVFKKIGILPIIPMISYTYKF